MFKVAIQEKKKKKFKEKKLQEFRTLTWIRQVLGLILVSIPVTPKIKKINQNFEPLV